MKNLRATLLLVFTATFAGCVHPSLSPIPGPGQSVIYRDGHPAVISRKARSNVALTLASTEVNDHALIVVDVENKSGSPANLGTENVRADFMGRPLHVFSARELIRNERTGAVFAAIGTGIGGAVRSSDAARPVQTQVGGNVFDSNGQRLGSYRGTVTSTDPAGTALAQSAINAETNAQMASVRAGSESRIQEINRVILKTTTIMPGQTYHGGIEINNTGMGDPVCIHVDFAGETHDFSFHLGR